MKLKQLFLSTCLISTVFLTACHAQDNTDTSIPTSQASLINFGDNSFEKNQRDLLDPNTAIHIIQLGDSHTAGGFFTDELRRLMKAQQSTLSGGWIPPLNIKAQRHTPARINSTGWTVIDSRRQTDPNYPLGGFIAQAQTLPAAISINLNSDQPQKQTLGIWLRASTPSPTPLEIIDANNATHVVTLQPEELNGRWHYQSIRVLFPIKISTQQLPTYELGGYFLEQQERQLTSATKTTFSAVGANGAQLQLTEKWGDQWLQQLTQTKAKIIILAYGTNESMVYPSKLAQQEQNLQNTIQKIKVALPESSIIILGTPDFLPKNGVKDTESACTPQHTAYYRAIKAMQARLAKENHVLFWDTELAMGGPCSILLWRENKLAQADLIHLTQAGYRELAQRFFQDLSKTPTSGEK